jgi:uncharacterized membrane protein
MTVPPIDHVATKSRELANPGPILGRVLGYGSRASVIVIAVGFILALVQNEHGGVGLKPAALVTAIEHGHGTGILGLGMALLIATPIAREAFALRFFAQHEERAFVVLSAIVLALVVCSSLIGGH